MGFQTCQWQSPSARARIGSRDARVASRAGRARHGRLRRVGAMDRVNDAVARAQASTAQFMALAASSPWPSGFWANAADEVDAPNLLEASPPKRRSPPPAAPPPPTKRARGGTTVANLAAPQTPPNSAPARLPAGLRASGSQQAPPLQPEPAAPLPQPRRPLSSTSYSQQELEDLRAESEVARENCIPWRERCPPGEAGQTWRGQQWREGPQRWASRGGANRGWCPCTLR